MSIGSSGGTAVKYDALLAAPLGLAVLACCGPRLLPRRLAVLPDDMVPGIICPGMYTHVFWVGAVFCDRLIFLRCVVHNVRRRSSFFVLLPSPDVPV